MGYTPVIACLDLKDGRVVKGVRFENLRDAGDPVESVSRYCAMGVDEVVLLDISATTENRGNRLEVLRKVASACTVPLCSGGGHRSIGDIGAALDAGADKVSVNTAAVRDPELVRRAVAAFGGEKLVVAIDARREADGRFGVLLGQGRIAPGLDAVEWARQVADMGAGSILLTSHDVDGTLDGYDLAMTRAVSDAVSVPVIASGGAGKPEDFLLAVTEGHAGGVLAASLFHFGTLTVGQVKDYLRAHGV